MESIEKKPKRKKLPKDILNVVRTTMRNNIELTHIADNKANVLLSLNALMLTFLIPFAIPYLDTIIKYKLILPIAILIITCTIVIYLAALVLKPGKFFSKQKKIQEGRYMSPFFFGNFYKMGLYEYREYLFNAVSDNELMKDHITEDMHYIGARLGRKMTLIRIAFNIFLIGLIITISVTCFNLFYYS